ncbi:hypothetical protein MYU51_008617 [Penicillium brevicompactum]|uniref:uncharacterized protein n=1 Tax=Penicillium brevicompactum TaxID=5074 RepID=UPI002541252A|nr:uncharacterized protein N7506_005205 [Penicillium brevicompactum]KAJ5337183.1 hypothetical protein N7506_005205 [Penicillium brevicompactum]
MRLSIIYAATTLLAATTATPTHSRAHAARNLDLSHVPILSLCSALVDSLPVNAEIKMAPNLDLQKVLSCVVDALPVHPSLAAMTPSIAAPSFTVAPITLNEAETFEVAKNSVFSIVSAIVDKLPVDVKERVLPDGPLDLSKLDLNSIASCVDILL